MISDKELGAQNNVENCMLTEFMVWRMAPCVEIIGTYKNIINSCVYDSNIYAEVWRWRPIPILAPIIYHPHHAPIDLGLQYDLGAMAFGRKFKGNFNKGPNWVYSEKASVASPIGCMKFLDDVRQDELYGEIYNCMSTIVKSEMMQALFHNANCHDYWQSQRQSLELIPSQFDDEATWLNLVNFPFSIPNEKELTKYMNKAIESQCYKGSLITELSDGNKIEIRITIGRNCVEEGFQPVPMRKSRNTRRKILHTMNPNLDHRDGNHTDKFSNPLKLSKKHCTFADKVQDCILYPFKITIKCHTQKEDNFHVGGGIFTIHRRELKIE